MQALQAVEEHRLSNAIALLRQFLSDNPFLRGCDELERIDSDYQLMLDYMKRGFIDPAREQIYDSLLHRLYRCIFNLRMSYLKKQSPFFIEAAKRVPTYSLSHERIRQELETFVTDIAMLSLEIDEVHESKSAELHQHHSDFMSSLFNSIVVSPQWTEADMQFFQQLLLSPTIDTMDAQLLISAIMLSAMNSYDFLKFSTLMHVYRHVTDEAIRQRALVGWVFALNREQVLFPEQSRLVREACQDPQTVSDLVDMQKQIIFCMKADADYEQISRDIMPTIIKNNNLNITRQGIIIEKEDDPMEDILDPGAADRRMEEMEESIRKMVDMQRAGSDIYFGGFSQMKRFPFFYNLTNWFTPFYVDHPGLSNVVAKLRGRHFMSNLLASGPFCDSDKYSFALAMATIVDRLPDNLKSMLDSAEALGPSVDEGIEWSNANGEDLASDKTSLTSQLKRRMYLQDLYRFYRLYPQKNTLVNPFDIRHFVFAASPVFSSTPLASHYAALCTFFRKQKNQEAFSQLIVQYIDDDDIACKLLRATYYLEHDQPALARPELIRLLELQPDHERGQLLMARACFSDCEYDQAAEYYGMLYQRHPNNKNYSLNYCLALCKTGDYTTAVNLLYKLDYQHPDQPDIMRIQAWALMGARRLEQAQRIYARLLSHKSTNPSDHLNAAYCYWFQGDITHTVSLLTAYVQHLREQGRHTNLTDDFADDTDILSLYHITTTDQHLIADLVMGYGTV